MTETFNNFFLNVSSNLADKIPDISTKFKSYFPNITTAPSDKPLTEKELKDAFFAMKTSPIFYQKTSQEYVP